MDEGNKIQLGILILMFTGMMGAFASWADTRFASADSVKAIDTRVEKVEQLPTDVAVIKEEVHEIKSQLNRHWK